MTEQPKMYLFYFGERTKSVVALNFADALNGLVGSVGDLNVLLEKWDKLVVKVKTDVVVALDESR